MICHSFKEKFTKNYNSAVASNPNDLNYALVALFYAKELETETGTFKTLKIIKFILKKFDEPLFTKNVDTRFIASPWHIHESDFSFCQICATNNFI